MSEKFRESLNEKPDKYLLEMLLIKPEEYEESALKTAKDILERRNVNIEAFENDFEFMGAGIKKQSLARAEEKSKSELTIGILLIAGGLAIDILAYFTSLKLGFIGLVTIVYGFFMIIKYYIQRWKSSDR